MRDATTCGTNRKCDYDLAGKTIIDKLRTTYGYKLYDYYRAAYW